MPKDSPLMWMPKEVVEVTNLSSENFVLYLPSGMLRLDAGRTMRLTASATEDPELVKLANAGKVRVVPYKKK